MADRRTRVLLFSALVVSLCGLCVCAFGREKLGSPTDQPLSLSAYTGRIDRWTSALERLKDHPEDVAAMRGQVPPSWPVMIGGRRIEVSTAWLRAGLSAIAKDPKTAPKNLSDLLAHLQAMRHEAQVLADSPEGSEASARATLNKILSRSEFSRVHGPTWLDRLWERIRAWLLKWISLLNLRIHGSPKTVGLLYWAILICAAGGLLAWMVRRLMQRSGTRDLSLRSPQVDVEHSWQLLAREAQRAAARGEYREAVRLAYWAAIHRLDELEIWTVDHTRTHREYLRLVRSDQPQREPLATLTRQFELAWYGGRPFSASDFESVLTQLEKLGCA